MMQSGHSGEFIYQRQDGYWITSFAPEESQFYGQTRHEVIEQIISYLERQVPYYKGARISMDELEGPQEIIKRTLSYLEQQTKEYNVARTWLRKALEGSLEE